MNVIAFDLSLSSTGVCAPDDGLYRIRPKFTGVDRLAYMRHMFEQAIKNAEPDLIVVEDLPPSTGGKYDTSGIAMAHAVFQLKCFDLGVNWTYINPSHLKKYATGRGNAPKDLVLTEAVRRLGYQGSSNDESDALWLWTMGVDHVTGEYVVPESHRTMMLPGMIEWRMAQ